MTSWPWMKGIDVAVADPAPLVDERDNRPSVKELIEDNRQQIYEVRRDLLKDPLYRSKKHDDLWILRFVMSHKKSKNAAKAAKSALLFRQEHNLDEQDIRFRPPGPSEQCNSEAIKRYFKYLQDDAIRFVLPDEKRGVVGFLRLASFDQHGLVENVDEADWLTCFSYLTEWSHQWLDYVTRTTGRLTKTVRIMDLKDSALLSVNHEMNRRDGNAMHAMEDFYPQLLQSIFICNSPAWVQIPWRIVRAIFPRRVTEKIDFINPKKNEKERKRLFKYISEENLPSRFGGKNGVWPVEYPLSKEQ